MCKNPKVYLLQVEDPVIEMVEMEEDSEGLSVVVEKTMNEEEILEISFT